jgi:phenylacetate-CoA ligase
MNERLLALYHRLPAPARSWAACVRGLYLRSWRYGPETERLMALAEERESWSPGRWRAWQEEQLARVLHRAATQTPYYREQWAERRRRGDYASWERLENWLLLDKEPLRRTPRAFLADDCRPSRMFHEHTSGTTGKPLELWWSRRTVREWYALFEVRCRRWYGVSRVDRWANAGGQLVAPVERRRPPFWVWNPALRQLYLSSYHLAPDLIPYYLDEIARRRVRYLLGYTSSLYILACEALRRGRTDLAMQVVITNAEPLYDYQRAAIARAFGSPVRETYGMAEVVAAASECPEGRLHLWPEVGWVEVLDGELVCTGLLNPDMPLVRYRIGDRGVPAADGEACPCGRGLPLLGSLEGRADDVLHTADGRRVGRLDPAFKGGLPIVEAQIIQEALDRVRVRYVPGPGFDGAAGRSLVERLRSRLGPVHVVLEATPEVPRERNGKFRAVICNLPRAERRDANRDPDPVLSA